MVSSLVDTQHEIVTERPVTVRSLPRRHLWWALPLAVIGYLGVLVVGVSSVLPSKFVASKRDCVQRDDEGACVKKGEPEDIQFAVVPADATPVEPLVSVKGPPTYGGSGELLFVTVRQPELTALEWFVGRQNLAVDYKSYSDLYSNETPQQQNNRGQVDMRTAKQTAEFVALKYLGFDAKLNPGDVIIDEIVCLTASSDGRSCTQYAPSDKVLDPGDKLIDVDGTHLATVDDLTAILAKHKAGDVVKIQYERDGKPGEGDVTLIAAPDEPERPIIGFYPSDTATISLPSDVSIGIATESIGGPSAGLAFTLTLIDELSKGDLLGGNRVAVTGTININGEVGAIGGLTSKASAVLQSGAKYFLVPAAQGDADIANARQVVGKNVQVIPVATLDEALRALQSLGGELPPAAPTTSTSTPSTTAP
jgi:Lon-like protease